MSQDFGKVSTAIYNKNIMPNIKHSGEGWGGNHEFCFLLENPGGECNQFVA